MFSNPFFQADPKTQFGELNAARIGITLGRLTQRIGERFPGSGLRRVSGEVGEVATTIEALCQWLRRPIWLVRLAAIGAGIGIIGIVVFTISLSMRIAPEIGGITDFLQGIESVINEIIFLAIALFFLGTLEVRLKRRVALQALHRLRSFAHVVDMHQLTKDPAFLMAHMTPTPSSPERILTPHELARYLDYCSELLSIISKLAALLAQYLNDPVVLNAVNDVESLAHSLSAKIWQKIMVLYRVMPEEEEESVE